MRKLFFPPKHLIAQNFQHFANAFSLSNAVTSRFSILHSQSVVFFSGLWYFLLSSLQGLKFLTFYFSRAESNPSPLFETILNKSSVILKPVLFFSLTLCIHFSFLKRAKYFT